MVNVDSNEILSATWSDATPLPDVEQERGVGERGIDVAFWHRLCDAAQLTRRRVAQEPNLRELIVGRFGEGGEALTHLQYRSVYPNRVSLAFLAETNPELRGQQRRMYSRKISFVDVQEAVFTTFERINDVFPSIEREFGPDKLALSPVGVIASRFVARCGAYKEPLSGTVFSAVCLYVYKHEQNGVDYGPKAGCSSRTVREWDPATKQLLGYIHRDAYVNMANLIMATSSALAHAVQTPFETAPKR